MQTGFENLTEEEFDKYLSQRRYGKFTLTDGLTPSPGFIPTEGYHVYKTEDGSNAFRVSISSEQLLDVFYEMLDLLAPELNIVVLSSHGKELPTESIRENIDTPVFLSILQEYDDVLQHDGYFGLAIYDHENDVEIQIDEHKIISVFGDNVREFLNILEMRDIIRNDELEFITDHPHLHSTKDTFARKIDALRNVMGATE